MARLVAAFASSHSVMLTCELRDWQRGFREFDPGGSYFDREGNVRDFQHMLKIAPPGAAALVTDEAIAARFAEVHASMARLRGFIEEARLDTLVICGDDQKELFSDELMPSMGVYYGETIHNAAWSELAASEWYKRAQMLRREKNGARDYPVDSALARHFIDGLLDRDFDVAALGGLPKGEHEGHAFSFVHRTYLQGRVIPIVPIFLNTFYPPNQPRPPRCLALGVALRELIESFPGDARVGLIASGGLSHFCVEDDLDHAVMDALRRKDRDFLARLDPKRLQAGSSEIRNWIVLAGATPDFDLDWISYTPGYRTEALTGTGLAFAALQPRA